MGRETDDVGWTGECQRETEEKPEEEEVQSEPNPTLPSSHLPNRSSLVKSGKREKARVWAEEAECPWRSADWKDRWREGSGGGLYLPTYL